MKKRVAKRTEFEPAKAHVSLTTGEVLKLLRELKGWTQREVAERSGVSVTNLSLLENGHIDLGKKRALLLAKAFGVHPAIIMFPEFEAEAIGLVA